MSAIQLTLAEAETAVWTRLLDNDAAGHRLSQTVLDALLNRAYCIVKGIRDDRPKLLAANSTGLQFSSGAKIATTTLSSTIRHVLSAWLSDGVTSTGFLEPVTGFPVGELQRWTRGDIVGMVNEDPTVGVPSAYAVWRNGTATATDVGRWSMSLWRIPDSTYLAYYVALLAIVDPTPLSTSTDKFDVDPDVSQAIVDMTAAIGARLVGRPEEADEIRRDVPGIFNSAFTQMESEFFGKSAAPSEPST